MHKQYHRGPLGGFNDTIIINIGHEIIPQNQTT